MELKSEQKKAAETQQQLRSTEAELFNAGHQLKAALKAADRGKELERIVETMQKKFLLWGEVIYFEWTKIHIELFVTNYYFVHFLLQAQLRLEENSDTFSPTIKQEATQIQKSYTEELNSKCKAEKWYFLC